MIFPNLKVSSFSTQHWNLQESIASFPSKIIDIGVAGHFIFLEEAMKEYDNPE